MTPFATDVSAIVLDIETAPLENVRDFLEPPDLSDISAPSNYKDPLKIAAYVEEAKVKALADYERDVTGKAALDFNCARIVAIGWWKERTGTEAVLCRDEQDEREAIDQLWDQVRHRMVVGFKIREFDIPMLIQRSRFLNIAHPLPDLGRYARGSGIVDLHDVLTFNSLRRDPPLMRQSVKAFARRFGIPVTDPIDGSQIPALVASGAWDQVRSHVVADVETEVALAQRVGVIAAGNVAQVA
jgi:hypothetical protein